MNSQLQAILEKIEQSDALSNVEKEFYRERINEIDKKDNLPEFKTDRIEKERHSLSVMLEESIENLQRKAKSIEAQKRELEIEAALERVRTKAMAMQKSDELTEVAELLFKEINDLGVKPWTTGFNVWSDDNNSYTDYITNPQGGFMPPYTIDATVLPVFIEMSNAKKRGTDFFINYEEGETLVETYRQLGKFGKDQFKSVLESGFQFPSHQYEHFVFGSKVSLMFITYEPVPEAHDLFKRFGKVFEQTYTRFLDIKKAEEQTREAQIEAALERVRSKAMAMNSSEDVTSATVTMFTELQKLGVENFRCGINHIKTDRTHEVWSITHSTEGQTVKAVGSFNIDAHPFWRSMYEAWIDKKDSFYGYLTGKEKKDYINILNATPNYLSQPIRDFPDVYFHLYFFGEGTVWTMTFHPPSEDERQIMKRFASVFSLTFSRYQDLKKTEAQAREAQIQLALERVRARMMAMHKSSDLLDVIKVLGDQFQLLGFKIHSVNFNTSYREKDWNLWLYNPGSPLYPDKIHVPYFDHPFFNRTLEALASGADFNSLVFTKKEKDGFFDHLYSNTIAKNASEERKKLTYNAPGFAWSTVYLKNTALTIANYDAEPYTEEQNTIIRRFGNAFEQTYTRFLDLQKAEALAKEAEIELALERVRAKTMAMQKSEELKDTTLVLFQQFKSLGATTAQVSICVFDQDLKNGEMFVTLRGEKIDRSFVMELDEEVFVIKKVKKLFLDKQKKFSFSFHGKELQDYNRWRNLFIGKKGWDESDAVQKQSWYVNGVIFSRGMIGISADIPPSNEALKLLERFGNVFDLTFTRFLDLQKAETQAREAQIEAAMEKVRGKAMAMHSSSDLSVTASMFFTELRKLGINPIRGGVGLLNKESTKAQLYFAASSEHGDALSLIGWVQLEKHPVLEKIYDSWIHQYDYFPELQKKELKSYYKLLLAGLPVRTPLTSDHQKEFGHFFPFSVGSLYVWSDMRYNETEIKIIKRFASIIDLTFRRYIELQQSEMNAKEAVKQSALDRVRADIASMRTVADLDRITPLIWKELTILGIPFIRCGVFIMDESEKLIHTFLSTPDGKAIAAFHLPYDTTENFEDMVMHWRNKKPYISHWNKSDFLSLAETLVNNNFIAKKEQYLSTLPNEGVCLHYLPFMQGMLYVGNTTYLDKEAIILIQHLANAFATAYARYEDFNKLEAAKQQVDTTLNELRATQKQLIQSEKMASLGELTAGIAHEIQNPLNFVNNFSEINKELIEELNTERSKPKAERDERLENELLNDIKNNEEKINHHGKRADSIVKGMLQHSRSSSGQKEATDINVLVDEYLRLAYHGLRAKDKSFNAKFETDFDSSLRKINIIPQDIGRVILNLITNAFYATSEKQKAESLHPNDKNRLYEPLVRVSSGKNEDKIEVRVEDNGSGIPQNIIDKIFQPFFTTKPAGQGTGLGLSLAYDIIKAHDGALKVETKEGEGTTFIVILPATQ